MIQIGDGSSNSTKYYLFFTVLPIKMYTSHLTTGFIKCLKHRSVNLRARKSKKTLLHTYLCFFVLYLSPDDDH